MAENFFVEKNNGENAENENNDTLNMTVSPICHSDDGKKYAFVTFDDGERSAEGRIPECTIIKNYGFTDEEIKQLENYMNNNLSQLKKTASGIHILDAMMK